MAHLWRRASKHQGGGGLAGGSDLTVAKPHLASLLKGQKLKERNLLLHVLQGTLATSDTGVEVTCPGCGIEMPTLLHKLWLCPAVVEAVGPCHPDWLPHLEDLVTSPSSVSGCRASALNYRAAGETFCGRGC